MLSDRRNTVFNLTSVYISQLYTKLPVQSPKTQCFVVCVFCLYTSLLTCHMTHCVFCLCRDFDLQLFPDTDLFHPDFTLNTGSQTVRKHSMRSYFYSGFDRSECLFGYFCTFALSPFKSFGPTHTSQESLAEVQKLIVTNWSVLNNNVTL